ncbi:hypothetical protein B0T26DRAFT_674738 [Lasiosphaeria miniovina]|uniref:Uncharacterized protein n=1 Tax=Lasiosphaeria miniovina TaxID=1954250 RepID=A0AA40E134_9PEZI|nr:uncharacterized protein B0T26DRAFT_674738 [Lasiosphaeria miniovina]KAK0723125.1 hypothetical protein B0T26DRAFT_674738 [Lasiosphaeria miniovina]
MRDDLIACLQREEPTGSGQKGAAFANEFARASQAAVDETQAPFHFSVPEKAWGILLLDIATHILPDHPWQTAVLVALGNLKQRAELIHDRWKLVRYLLSFTHNKGYGEIDLDAANPATREPLQNLLERGTTMWQPDCWDDVTGTFRGRGDRDRAAHDAKLWVATEWLAHCASPILATASIEHRAWVKWKRGLATEAVARVGDDDISKRIAWALAAMDAAEAEAGVFPGADDGDDDDDDDDSTYQPPQQQQQGWLAGVWSLMSRFLPDE